MTATVAHQTGLPEACAQARAALDALDAALETFRRLGSAPWTRRAKAELRACGEDRSEAPGQGWSQRDRYSVSVSASAVTS